MLVSTGVRLPGLSSGKEHHAETIEGDSNAAQSPGDWQLVDIFAAGGEGKGCCCCGSGAYVAGVTVSLSLAVPTSAAGFTCGCDTIADG